MSDDRQDHAFLDHPVGAVAPLEGRFEGEKDRYRSVFEYAPIGIALVALDGRWLEVNRSLCRFLGTTEAELLQSNLHDYLHPEDHGPDLSYPSTSDRTAADALDGRQVQLRFLHKSGRLVWGNFSVSAVRSGDGAPRHVIVQVQDLSATKEAERGLAESEARYRSLVDSLQEGVMLLSASGRVLTCNSSAERILGLSEEQLKGDGRIDEVFQAVREDGTPFALEDHPVSQALRSGRSHSDAIMRVDRPDGKRVWIHLNARPLYQQGNLTPHAVVASFSDITATKEKESALARLAYDDPLTGLPNRRSFFLALSETLADRARDERTAAAVLLLDLDGFRKVNEKFGHAAGDALLSEVAGRLAVATEPGEFVARLGGDEFAVLRRQVDGPAGAIRLAERILALFETPTQAGESAHTVDVRIGVATASRAEGGADELARRADLALQRARRTNARIQVYNSHLDAQVRRALELERDLRGALAKRELDIYYQPIIDLERGCVTSSEALLHWHHPRRGTVSSAEFIPVAEESGLILPIGEWLIERALGQLEALQARQPDLRLSLNLSPKQLEQPGFLALITSAIRRSGVRPDSLLLELTETYVMQRVEEGGKKLRDLADLGVGIAIDDFGTGYSSLSYLQHLPITHVKVDRSFIRRVPDGGRGDTLVRAIFALARTLDLTVIAEGIETEAQARFLRDLGCRFGQGFLFYRPLPVEDYGRLVGAPAADPGA